MHDGKNVNPATFIIIYLESLACENIDKKIMFYFSFKIWNDFQDIPAIFSSENVVEQQPWSSWTSQTVLSMELNITLCIHIITT